MSEERETEITSVEEFRTLRNVYRAWVIHREDADVLLAHIATLTAENERLRETLEDRNRNFWELAHAEEEKYDTLYSTWQQAEARTRALEAEIDLLHRELDRANAEAVQAGHMIVRKNAALARPCIACGYEPKMIRPAALTEPTPPAGPA